MLMIAAGDAHAARIEVTKMSDKTVIYPDIPVNYPSPSHICTNWSEIWPR